MGIRVRGSKIVSGRDSASERVRDRERVSESVRG